MRILLFFLLGCVVGGSGDGKEDNVTEMSQATPHELSEEEKAKNDVSSEAKMMEHISKVVANAKRAGIESKTREKNGKLSWEKSQKRKSTACYSCQLGCLSQGGACQKYQGMTEQTCTEGKGEWCDAVCTHTDGKEASTVYPCTCGYSRCSPFQLCDKGKSSNQCMDNTKELHRKKTKHDTVTQDIARKRVEELKSKLALASARRVEAESKKEIHIIAAKKAEAELKHKKETKHRAKFFEHQKKEQETKRQVEGEEKVRHHKIEIRDKELRHQAEFKKKQEEELRRRKDESHAKVMEAHHKVEETHAKTTKKAQEVEHKKAEGHSKKLTQSQELDAKREEAVHKRNGKMDHAQEHSAKQTEERNKASARVQEANAKYNKEHNQYSGRWESIIKKDEVVVRSAHTALVVAKAKRGIAAAEDEKNMVAHLDADIALLLGHLGDAQKKLADDEAEATGQPIPTGTTPAEREARNRAHQEKLSKSRMEAEDKAHLSEKATKSAAEARQIQRDEENRRENSKKRMAQQVEFSAKSVDAEEKAANAKSERQKKGLNTRLESEAKVATKGEEEREKREAKAEAGKEEKFAKLEAENRLSDQSTVDEAEREERQANERVTKAEAVFARTAVKAKEIKKEAQDKAEREIADAKLEAKFRVHKARDEATGKIAESKKIEEKYDKETAAHRREIQRLQEKDSKSSSSYDRRDLLQSLGTVEELAEEKEALHLASVPASSTAASAAVALIAVVVMAFFVARRRSAVARAGLETPFVMS